MIKEFKGYLIGSGVVLVGFICLGIIVYATTTRVKSIKNCYHIESLFVASAKEINISHRVDFSIIGKKTLDGQYLILSIYPQGGDELAMKRLKVVERGFCLKEETRFKYKIESLIPNSGENSNVIR